jgi:hypothetical protein
VTSTSKEPKMESVRPDVRAFFERYERAGKDPGGGALSGCFCELFMSLDPRSASVLSPQELEAALPRRRKLFEAIGSDGLELAEMSEMPLDDLHTLVRTTWNLKLRAGAPGRPVTLRSTFLLHQDAGAWRIALYLNHQDMSKIG